MSAGRATARWGSGLATTFLLSLIPAYFAGLVALMATAGLDQGLSAGAVAVAFIVTLTAFMVWGRAPSMDQVPHRNAPNEAGKNKWVSIALLASAVPVSVLITYPQLSRFGSLILGNTGDSGLNIYLLEWQIHAAIHHLGSYLDLNIFAPEKFTLFWGPSLIPIAPLYAVAKLATGNVIASFNLMMVAVTFATLVATYLFARKAGFGPLSSALGALLYTTTAQRIAHLGHLDSFQTLWIPIFATLILSLWQENRARHGVLLGIALGFSLSAAPYYFLAGLALLGLMVAIHLPRWKTIPWRGVAAAGVTTLLLGGPVLVLSKLAGLSRSPEEVFPISWADFYHPGFFIPTVRWLAEAAGREGGGKTLENWLFPSVVMLILAAIGSWAWLRASREGRSVLPESHPRALPSLMAACAVSGIVMGIGPHLRLGERRIPLPMLVMMKLPGFDSLRVTGRFLALTFLALTIVCLVGLEWALSKIRGVARPALIVAAGVLALATTQAFYPAVALDASGSPAMVNRELAKRPAGLVVELPWPGCPGYGCLFTEPPRMIWSRFDWLPRLGGYSGHIPDYWPEAQEALTGFPDQRSFEFLDKFGVRYLILRVNGGEESARFDGAAAADLSDRAREFPQVREVRKVGDDYLLTLR